MGYGYQKYVSKHPDAQSKEQQTKQVQPEAATNGERVLDISEWQGDLTLNHLAILKYQVLFHHL